MDGTDMKLEPVYQFSNGMASFWYVYKGLPKVMLCEGVVEDVWTTFKSYCANGRYKDAMNLIKKYIKEEE